MVRRVYHHDICVFDVASPGLRCLAGSTSTRRFDFWVTLCLFLVFGLLVSALELLLVLPPAVGVVCRGDPYQKGTDATMMAHATSTNSDIRTDGELAAALNLLDA